MAITVRKANSRNTELEMAAKSRRCIIACDDLHNLGDVKILVSNLLTLAEPALVRHWNVVPPAITSLIHGHGAELLSAKRVSTYLAYGYGSDVILGGGQMVRDKVSIPSLLSLALTVFLSKLGGGRVSARGLGVDVIRTPVRKALWWAILRCCDKVRVRDQASAECASLLVGPDHVELTADMVFLPSDSAPSSSATIAGSVVLAPCNDESEHRKFVGPATNLLLKAVMGIIASPKVTIACHDPRANMDRAAADDVLRENVLGDATCFESYDLAALQSLYQGASLVVTNRLHAVILAILCGKPVIAVDDSTPKLTAICEDFHIPTITNTRTYQLDEMRIMVERALNIGDEQRCKSLTITRNRALKNLGADPVRHSLPYQLSAIRG